MKNPTNPNQKISDRVLPAEFIQCLTEAIDDKIYNIKSNTFPYPDLEHFDDEEINFLFDHLLCFQDPRTSLIFFKDFFQTKREILIQFVKCNLTNLYKKMDITTTVVNLEKIDCPHKKLCTCPFNGVGVGCIKV